MHDVIFAFIFLGALFLIRRSRLISWGSWDWWRYMYLSGHYCGFFRNTRCKKWHDGKLLPWRWGFFILGFEFGDRGSWPRGKRAR